jgi:hypothetical protein
VNIAGAWLLGGGEHHHGHAHSHGHAHEGHDHDESHEIATAAQRFYRKVWLDKKVS